ncbi:MAG: methyltransferase domain-containing protein [Planctomycetota bacterium]
MGTAEHYGQNTRWPGCLEYRRGSGALQLVRNKCIVHALDISELALDRVRDVVAGTWRPGELADLPSDFFDLAISNLVAQHMNDEELLEQMRAVVNSLKPDGVFALQFAYSLNAKYDSCNSNKIPENAKLGRAAYSLSQMSLLVEKARGKILWANKIGAQPECNIGWYGIHIVRDNETNPLLLNRSMESRQDVAKLFNADAEELFNAGDVDGAEAAFRRAVELDPEFALAHNNLGVVYHRQSNHQLALKHLGEAVRLEPGNRPFIANYDELLESMETVNEQQDNGLIKEGDMNDRGDSAKQGIRADSTSAKDPNEEVLVEACELSDTKTNCSSEDENIDDDSVSIGAWRDHCQTDNHWYLTGSKGSDVWDRLNIEDKVVPGQVVLNIGVGLGYCTEELARRKCVVHALDISETALDRVRHVAARTWLPGRLDELPADFFDLAISNLVTQHMNDDDLFEQMSAVLRGLKPDGIFAMQFAYSLNGQYDSYKANPATMKAGGVYRSLTKMNLLATKARGRIIWADKIGNCPEWNNGWYGIHIVRNDEANPLLQNRSMESRRDVAKLFNADAEDLFNAGDVDGAEESFREAVELDPEFAVAHNNLGVVYYQQANNDLALKHFEKAVDLEPGNRSFLANHQKLLESLEAPNEQQGDGSQPFEMHPHNAQTDQVLKTPTDPIPVEVNRPSLPDEPAAAAEEPMIFLQGFRDHDLQFLVRNVVDRAESVLEVGCGLGAYLERYTNAGQRVVGVEPYLPYLEESSKRVPWAEFQHMDALTYFAQSQEKFDCVLLIDVVEHLEKDQAVRMVQEAIKHCKKIVFCQTPFGRHVQDHDPWGMDGHYWQTHKSTWDSSNLRELGFSFYTVWKDWYEWEQDEVDKSRDVTIAAWLPDFDEDRFTILIEVGPQSSLLDLERTLQSLQSQTYPKFQAIIVKNDLPNKSEALVEQYQATDSRIQAVRCAGRDDMTDLEQNLSRTGSGLLLTVQCGDVLAPNKLERHIKLLKQIDAARKGDVRTVDLLSSDSYVEALRKANLDRWQQAYRDGYDSDMGDHRSYFYNEYLETIGYYDQVARGRRIVEFAPGNGEFFEKFISDQSQKEFLLVDISQSNLDCLRERFSGYNNVTCILNDRRQLALGQVDSVFSFLLCQSMPKTLWIEHLTQVYNMLADGGSYVFQFAYHPEGAANDSVGDSVAGSQKYSPEQMLSLVERAGFENIELSEPIGLEPFDTDIIWYLCKAIK